MKQSLLLATLAAAASAQTNSCSADDQQTITSLVTPCLSAEDVMACLKTGLQDASVGETCKSCLSTKLASSDKDTALMNAMQCLSDGAGGGDAGGDNGGMVPGAFPPEMADKLCELLPKMLTCMKPIMDVVADATCKDALGELGGELDFSDFDPKQLIDMLQCNKDPAAGRRLLAAEPAHIEALQENLHALRHLPRRLMDMDEDGDIFEDMTEEGLKKMCADGACMKKFFGALKPLPECLMPVFKEMATAFGGDAGMDMLPTDEMNKGIDMMEKGMKLMCSKNAAGSFCLVDAVKTFEDDAGNDVDPTADPAFCDKVSSLGCCVGTFSKMAELENDMNPENDEKSEVDALKEMCKWEVLPKPCAEAGEKREVAKLKFVIKGIAKAKFDALPEDKKLMIKRAIKKDIAKKLGISPMEVDLGTLMGDGSGISITADVDPAAGKTPDDVSSAFTGELELTETKAELAKLTGESAVDVTTVSSDAVKADTETNSGGDALEDEPTDSGAAALTPALVVAAGLAALAL